MIAGDAYVDFVGMTFPHLASKMRVGKHRARHRHQVGVPRCYDVLGDFGRIDPVRSHHGNINAFLQPGGRKSPGGSWDWVGDGWHARLMPTEPGVQYISTGNLDPLRLPTDLVPGSATLNQIQRGDAIDDQKVRSGSRANAADYLDGKTMPVFLSSAPFVCAVIGPQDRELINKIAFRSHDLDTIESCVLRQKRATHIVGNCLRNIGRRHSAGRKFIDAGADIRRPKTLWLLSITARMQNL